MSNYDTGFIKFLTLLLVLGLMSGLAGCSSENRSQFNPTKAESIIGGEAVTRMRVPSKENVSYSYILAVLARWKTDGGRSPRAGTNERKLARVANSSLLAAKRSLMAHPF